MKYMLTSAGITNKSIEDALVKSLGKPVSECSALCIPTAMYGHPWVGPGIKTWEFISGNSENPMVNFGWKSVGILELTALPSIPWERWLPLIEKTDVFLVSGGDALYLAHWMRESGLAQMLPKLEAVYVGMSAGSMALAPRIGEDFMGWMPPSGKDEGISLIGFSIFPHLENESLPENTLDHAAKWASKIQGPSYAIDDQTAIKVTDGKVEVISEGLWKSFSTG
ncbi:Peptidase family S51 [Planococcus massiliensis]|uniref:Peptidase family S51 n=1 Tax=Planococcus massiliensis TaxID=1499687 RepID=A0A098ELU5_9BACL|nr:Type 1 glutamine amidotransferase-like domain-containing protein [Planococcus massiliensis]CEG22755.1 Peptidase family S51 [Planococcus massiliensis]